MLGGVIDAVAQLSAFGAGLVAGTFFAFSSIVMRTLGKLPSEQGIVAMQSVK